MTAVVLTFVTMAAVIVVSATFLARCADRIAAITGMSRSVAGLVLLAVATSLPEVTVGWNAVRIGAPDLTAGDLFGSSLFNLLILSIMDLLTRTRGRMLSQAAAAHALSATASVLMTAVALLGLLLDWEWAVLRLGPGSVMILAAYLFSLRLVYFDQQRVYDSEDTATPPGMTLRIAVAGYVVSAATILFAAPELTRSAEQLAGMTGLGQTFFGTAFVAAITSLPEAVTTLMAIRLGAIDMAVGNIFGSNAFNMVVLVLVDPAMPGPLLSAVSGTHAITGIAVILVTAVATMGLLYRAEKRWWIIEPDAILVAILIVAALALVYAQ